MSVLQYIDRNHVLYGVSGYLVYLFVYKVWIWPHFLSPLRKVPGPPLGNIIFGQSPNIIRSEVGTNEKKWVRQYGPTIRIVGAFGTERMLFLSPEALRQVLVKDWLEYPRPGFMKNILGLVTGYGLLTVTGDEHKQMRKAMNPAFSLPNLVAQTSMYYEPVEGLVNIFKDLIGKEDTVKGSVIHVYEWMSKVTLDIICETAFGYRADSLHNPKNELAEAYDLLLSLQSGVNLAKLSFLVTIPGVPGFLASNWAYKWRNVFRKLPVFSHIGDLVDAMYRIKQLSKAMLAEKMKDADLPLSDMEAKRDIMSILVRARRAEMDGGKTGYAMSDRAMMDQVLTFLGAGHETTASGLTWTLWFLANNLDHQRRLRAELEPIFSNEVRPEYRVLKDLQWLDAVVMEGLRIMPPVPVTAREAAKTDYIDGVLVPKGTLIYIPIRVMNSYKGLWGEDADEFNPARWFNLPEAYQPNISLLSFIAGPHACIGKTMSIIEMKMVLAYLIYNFEFEPSFVGQTIKPAAAITIKPTDGMPLRVRRIVRPAAA
ncbi:cytochrome P450 [Panaeolus papilionaceus]|nr:cytochrome P450 [Panaeolus papilionaceus]